MESSDANLPLVVSLAESYPINHAILETNASSAMRSTKFNLRPLNVRDRAVLLAKNSVIASTFNREIGIEELASKWPVKRLRRPFKTAKPRMPGSTFTHRFISTIITVVEMIKNTHPRIRECSLGKNAYATPAKNSPAIPRKRSVSAAKRSPLFTCDITPGFCMWLLANGTAYHFSTEQSGVNCGLLGNVQPKIQRLTHGTEE